MAMLGWLVGMPLFIIAPCAIGVWLGTRVRSPLLAFVIAWLTTPIAAAVVTLVFLPVLRELTPANNDGTGAIMLPILGIATGLVAGGVAAAIVGRRRRLAEGGGS